MTFLRPPARKKKIKYSVICKNGAQKLASPKYAGFGAIQPENECVPPCSPGRGARAAAGSLLPGHFLARLCSLFPKSYHVLELNEGVFLVPFRYLEATRWGVFVAHMPT